MADLEHFRTDTRKWLLDHSPNASEDSSLPWARATGEDEEPHTRIPI